MLSIISKIYIFQLWFIFNVHNDLTPYFFAQVAPQAVHVKGQEPLTASMLAAAPPQEQKQMLGERLFPLIQHMYPDLSGKITGMLLEIDNSELLHMLESRESLKAKVIIVIASRHLHVVVCVRIRLLYASRIMWEVG